MEEVVCELFWNFKEKMVNDSENTRWIALDQFSDIDLLVELSFCDNFENFIYILLKLTYHMLMSLFLLEFSWRFFTSFCFHIGVSEKRSDFRFLFEYNFLFAH